MKDHIKARWVNKITSDAKKYGQSHQTRGHIRDHVMRLIEVVEREAKAEQREKDAEIAYHEEPLVIGLRIAKAIREQNEEEI